MDTFYFSPEPQAKSNPAPAVWRHGGQEYTFTTDHGVFSRGEIDYGSYLLAETLPPLQGALLDLGCGYGFLGIAAALRYPGLCPTLCDINARALGLAKQNARSLNVACEILQGDGYAPVEGRRFDAILTNPPISAGKAVYLRWLEDAPGHLRPGGSLFFVMHKKHGVLSVMKALEPRFGAVRLLKRDAGYHIVQAET